MPKGSLYMLPMTLGAETFMDSIPAEVAKQTTELRYFIVENIKTTRRHLRRLDREFPIDESQFFELNKHTDKTQLQIFLKPALEGHNIGMISEAGCPGIADPGAEIASIAHSMGIRVKPLVGPSSILLTLMGSGFSGQEFCFHGYLAKERRDRVKQLKDFESDTYRTGKTHLFMDTPFRNNNVLEDLLNELTDNTLLCIASNLTMPDENIRTMSVREWRQNAYDLSKKPTMYGLGKFQ